jgi:hypothetical protein
MELLESERLVGLLHLHRATHSTIYIDSVLTVNLDFVRRVVHRLHCSIYSKRLSVFISILLLLKCSYNRILAALKLQTPTRY